MPAKIDLTGKRFGKLTVLWQDFESKDVRLRWVVHCDCSKVFSIRSNNLRSGNVVSCLTCKQTPKEEEIVGNQYGIYTIEKFIGYKKSGNKRVGVWLGKDNLGRYKELKTSDLYNKRGCNKGLLDKKEATERELYRKYQHSAIKRGISFNLTKEQFQDLIYLNCHYCGTHYSNTYTSKRGYTCNYNGIDRVDNTKGYLVNNSVACCIQCNKAKNVLSQAEFIKWCRKVLRHYEEN